jgi:hypothetical protein
MYSQYRVHEAFARSDDRVESLRIIRVRLVQAFGAGDFAAMNLSLQRALIIMHLVCIPVTGARSREMRYYGVHRTMGA